jgi:protease-4
MSAEAERIIQLNVEHIYRKFLQLVSQARELPVAELDAIAQGRVFTGTKAKSHGLVDNIGLLKDALDAAAGLAGLEQYDTKEVERDLNFQEQLARQLVYFTGLSPILRRDAASGDDGGLVQRTLRWLEDTSLVRRNDPANIYLECLECRWY